MQRIYRRSTHCTSLAAGGAWEQLVAKKSSQLAVLSVEPDHQRLGEERQGDRPTFGLKNIWSSVKVRTFSKLGLKKERTSR
jgi:hypothetical protein